MSRCKIEDDLEALLDAGEVVAYLAEYVERIRAIVEQHEAEGGNGSEP